jgi:outer membrane receptor protein involved in Fe transport
VSSSVPALPDGASDNGDRGSLEEIVVTAQKREERLLDVPISIVAISGDQLQTRQILSMDQLATVVPGLTYNNNGSNQYYAIRGVASGVGNSSLIGIYIDEADATLGGFGATQANIPTYDLERVEVLRGPQGTLYGQGSAGGTIHFVTRNPNLTSFGAQADVAGLFTKNGSPSTDLNGAVNIPLVQDQLALRLTGSFIRDGGWIDQPAAGKKDINDRNFGNVRAKLLWQPAPDFAVSVMAIVNRDSRGADITDQDSTYGYTQAFNITASPRVKNNYQLYNITTTYEAPSVKILNTATYVGINAAFTNQSGFFPFDGPATETPPYNYYSPGQYTHDRQFTDEIRLSSNGNGPWQWSIGSFYRNFKDSTQFVANYFGLPVGTTTELPDPYFTDLQTIYNSSSVFADTSYTLFERLTLGAGVRYFHDDQDFLDRVRNYTAAVSFHSVDPRFYARYKLNDNTTLYTSAAKGFRSGGFNKGRQPAYQPESVWTYELGSKADLFDRKLSFDAALFLSDYTDRQIFGVTDRTNGNFYLTNADSVRIKGGEWDFTLRPARQLTLGFGGAYIDAKIKKIIASGTGLVAGDRLQLIPRIQITASAQYDYLLAGRKSFFRLDYSHQSSKISFDRTVGPWYYGASAPQNILDATNSIDLGKNLTASVFVQNLLNEQGFSNPYAFIGNGVRPQPRTVGIKLAVQY